MPTLPRSVTTMAGADRATLDAAQRYAQQLAYRQRAAGFDSQAISARALAANPALSGRLAEATRKLVPTLEDYLVSQSGGRSLSSAAQRTARGIFESHMLASKTTRDLSRFDEIGRYAAGQWGAGRSRRIAELREMAGSAYAQRMRKAVAPWSKALEDPRLLKAQLAADKALRTNSRLGAFAVAELAMPTSPRAWSTLSRPTLDPRPLPTRRRPTLPAPEPVQPRILPPEVGEAIGRGLARVERQEAVDLLVLLGLTEELEHFEAIEECLLKGTRPSRIHAAMSADVLLKALANRLFPPRKDVWISRWQIAHKLEAIHTRNRLAAFIDLHLRGVLSTHEHKLLEATLVCAFNFARQGHHVAFQPRQAAEAFYQLLKVLSAVAKAHRASQAQ